MAATFYTLSARMNIHIEIKLLFMCFNLIKYETNGDLLITK